MNKDSIELLAKDEVARNAPPRSPILIVPYMWIGDFVRCHSVVKVLRARWLDRPVDLLTNTLCAPLIDYMPGVRKGRASGCRSANITRWPNGCGGKITARRW
jgi:heptosyltransferase II